MSNTDPKAAGPKKLKFTWPVVLAVVIAAVIGALVLQAT